MTKRTIRMGVALAALAPIGLIVTACGSGSSSPTTQSSPTTSSSSAMALPSYTNAWHTAFASPASGTTVTGNDLTVAVNATGYKLSCGWAGKANQSGIGHYHLMLDKSLVNMFCTPQATVSMQNIQPGPHTLEVVPALNDHSTVMGHGQAITFNYQPTNPLPPITAKRYAGPPKITIVSPANGQTVSGNFPVQVKITNFTPSCDLYGKLDVAGFGHWHVNWDTTSGAMGGMATMAGMSCTKTMQLSTAGLAPGSHHKLIAYIADNLHAAAMPMVSDAVDIKVGG